jgi:hypothetical protein
LPLPLLLTGQQGFREALTSDHPTKGHTMNTAYWLAIIWGVLALFALMFVTGKNTGLAYICLICAALASLLGVAISYNLL